MGMVLSAVGACLLFILKVVGILLLILLVLAALLLLCPFCADVCWQNDTLTVKAGALGITFPVFQYPKPAKPKTEKPPRQKAKITLDVICTMLRGVGTLLRAVFGAVRFTKISVCLGVRGDDPAEAARNYGKLQAWLYPTLGVLDRFFFLEFDQLRVLPDFGSAQPTVPDKVSFRVSAQALFIVIAAVRVLYEFWRKKVLDIFI